MARPIQRIEQRQAEPGQERRDALGEILGALAENKEALLTTVDILGEAHRAGALDLLQGILKNRHEVGVIALHQLNQPSIRHLIRNTMGSIQFLMGLNPDELNRWLKSIGAGLEHSAEMADREAPAGLWELGKWMRSQEVRSSLTLLVRFLQEMGRSIEEPPPGRKEESF